MRSPLPRLALFAAAALMGCGDPLEELELEASNCPDHAAVPADAATPPFVLFDAYYLQEEAARAVRRGEATSPEVEETFAKAKAMGVEVVRTWAFNDDPSKAGDTAMQVAPLSYDETALRGMDLVLSSASRYGVRLILPLGNFWDDYGGARQYVAWAGLPGPSTGDPRFFTDPGVVSTYRQRIADLLGRVSALDGIRYGDHPAVLAWELLNEPRADALLPGQMRTWAEQVAATIRAHAVQRIATGEEGQEATTGELLAAAGLDVQSIHLFPEGYGWEPAETAARGAQWISSHAEAAHGRGEALWLEELGLANDGVFTLDERRALYRGWLECARRSGLAGAGPWMFAYDARPDAWDRHTFYFRDGTAPSDPVNRYADLLISAAARLAATR